MCYTHRRELSTDICDNMEGLWKHVQGSQYLYQPMVCKYSFPFCDKFIWGKEPLLLLLLSRFSRVRLCATPETAAHQAPPSMGFSRQEHWSGLPFPSPMHESESESEVAQSCPTLSDPVDCSPPRSSVRGIFQARVLEWVAIAFSRGKELRSPYPTPYMKIHSGWSKI